MNRHHFPPNPLDPLCTELAPAESESSGRSGSPSESDPPSRPRRRGAPLGNKNALKHGFYAANFNKADVKAHQSYKFTGLTDEIALLRMYIRHVIALGAQTDDLILALDLLRVLSLSVTSLNRLVKTQALLKDGNDVISIAIREVYEELIGNPPAEKPPPPIRILHHEETGAETFGKDFETFALRQAFENPEKDPD